MKALLQKMPTLRTLTIPIIWIRPTNWKNGDEVYGDKRILREGIKLFFFQTRVSLNLWFLLIDIILTKGLSILIQTENVGQFVNW